ncbi:MAG: M1 family metallopeptidase [Proteobacteria bacterium]|nr:M1 family metallopeptidase [Pseudomonadota bacterium]
MTRYVLPVALLSALMLLSACGKDESKQDSRSAAIVPKPITKPDEPIPLGPLPRTATPSHYAITVTVDPRKDRFSGHTEIDLTFNTARKTLFIDGNDLSVKSVYALLPSGKKIPAAYAQVHPSGVAYLNFGETVPAGKARLVFDYDAPFNPSLAGLYKVVTKSGDAYAFTQFENIDARRMFPGFDEPGYKTPFDITVIAPGDDKVIANTPVVTDSSVGNGMMKWVFEQTKPLPTYLVALAIGPLDIVDGGDIPANAYRDHPVHLRGITAKGMGAKLKYALSLTPSVVEHLESYYGIGYPYQKLDVLAVPDFAAGAMENAGAVTFREQLLLMDDNAPLEQKRSSLDVQAHELAHQWFGDLVTPKWWDDIWLNESFATWMSTKISQQVKPDEEFGRERLISSQGVMRLDELPSARQIHNPVNNPDDIDNAFDDITYSKGAAILAMFESYVGPEQWQKGIHAYLSKFAFKNASAQDFIGTVAQATNHPEIVAAFNSFIDQPGIPLLKTELACGTGTAALSVAQSPYASVGIAPVSHHWNVPMCLSADGARTCKLVTPTTTQVALGGKCPAQIFPNADGAGYYRFGGSEVAWSKWIGAAPSLDAADQFTLFHNVDAAMRGGYGTAADYFATIKTLAPTAKWDLLESDHHSTFNIADSLHDLRVTGVIAPADAAKLQAFVRSAFGPRLAQLGLAARPNESPADALMRQYLVEILVEEGSDPALIAQLSKAADSYLASNGANNGGIAPELLQEALRAGVMSEGAPFADKVLAAMQASGDEFFIQSAIYAVAGASDEATLRKLLDMTLTPAIRTGDMRYVFRYMQGEAKGRDVAWVWFKQNYDALLKRLSSDGMSSTPDILNLGCDEKAKAGLTAFFGPKAAQLTGTPRTLKENVDRIDRCIAFKQAKGAEIAAAVRMLK